MVQFKHDVHFNCVSPPPQRRAKQPPPSQLFRSCTQKEAGSKRLLGEPEGRARAPLSSCHREGSVRAGPGGEQSMGSLGSDARSVPL